MDIRSHKIYCPYCGESISIVVDPSVEEQQYIEDCSVCCRPVELEVLVTGDSIQVITKRDDE